MTYTSDFLPLEDLPSTSQLSPRPEGRCPPHRSAPANGCRCIWSKAGQMSPPSVFPELSLEKSWNGTSGSSGKSNALTGKALIFVFIATASEWWPTCLLIDCRPSATGGEVRKNQSHPKLCNCSSIYLKHSWIPWCPNLSEIHRSEGQQYPPSIGDLAASKALRKAGSSSLCLQWKWSVFLGFKLVGSNCNYPLVI